VTEIPAFEVSYDYLCPFAHIAHEHLVAALQDGAGYDVTFTPWTLRQVHKDDGAPDVWDDPAKVDDLLSLESSIVVRDEMPELFLAAHLALYRARHDRGIPLTTRDEVAGVLTEVGVDADAVFATVDTGQPRKELGESWRRLVDQHGHFGVPTFIVGDDAVFVRIMSRPTSAADARGRIERTIDLLVNDVDLNEFKRPKIPR